MVERGDVHAVSARTVKDGRQVYTIHIGNIEATTFKRDLAIAAKALLHHYVEAEITTKKNGNFTNHYLESIQEYNGKAPSPSGPVDPRSTEIRKAVSFKAAIDMLPYMPPEQQTPHSVETMSRWAYRFLDSDWELDDEPAPQEFDDVPF